MPPPIYLRTTYFLSFQRWCAPRYIQHSARVDVDFERTGRLVNLLDSFMSSSGLVARDLAFRYTITFTYERDDGCVRSWIDHILCDKLHVDIVTNIKRADSGTFLSDHFPLSFSLNAECASVCPSFSSKPQKNNSFVCDWAKITSDDNQCFVADTLPRLPSEVELCCNPHCSQHCST